MGDMKESFDEISLANLLIRIQRDLTEDEICALIISCANMTKKADSYLRTTTVSFPMSPDTLFINRSGEMVHKLPKEIKSFDLIFFLQKRRILLHDENSDKVIITKLDIQDHLYGFGVTLKCLLGKQYSSPSRLKVSSELQSLISELTYPKENERRINAVQTFKTECVTDEISMITRLFKETITKENSKIVDLARLELDSDDDDDDKKAIKKLQYHTEYEIFSLKELKSLKLSFSTTKADRLERDSYDLKQRRRRSTTNDVVGCEVSFKRGVFYKHHAVVVYKSVTSTTVEIVHLTGDSADTLVSGKNKAHAAKKELEEKEINFVYTYEKAFPRELVALRAKFLQKIYIKSERMKDVRYDFLQYNCQHFACFCVTGRLFCKKLGLLCCGKCAKYETNRCYENDINDTAVIILKEAENRILLELEQMWFS